MPNKQAARKIHHASIPRIKDRDGNYDLDGVSQTKNYQVVVASDHKYLVPESFGALMKRVQKIYSITHHN